jgi:hypothetical protein
MVQGTDPDPIKGGTTVKKDTRPVYDVNQEYLASKSNGYVKRLGTYITSVFESAGALPIIDNKQLTGLEEITPYLNNPKSRGELYSQAMKLHTDSEDIDQNKFAFLHGLKFKIESDAQNITVANKLMNQDFLYAAEHADAKMNVRKSDWHKLILNKDGSFKTKQQFDADYAKAYQDYIRKADEEYVKNYPKPTQRFPHFTAKSDQPSVWQGRAIKDVDGNWINPQEYQSMNSQASSGNLEEWENTRQAARSKAINKISNFKNYDQVKARIINQYNNYGKNISAQSEGVFIDNQGGAKSALRNQTIKFDADDIKSSSKNLKPIEYTVDLLKKTKDNSDVLVIAGNFLEDNSRLPNKGDQSPSARRVLTQFYEDFAADAKSSKKDLQSRAYGQVTFQPIVAGDENYHAYHIKINPRYFERLQGSTDSPGVARGQGEIMNNGITLIVPVKDAESIKMSKMSLEGTRTTSAEAVLGLQDYLEYDIPNGAHFKVKRNPKNGVYNVEGYQLFYDPSKGKMDTVHLDSAKTAANFSANKNFDEVVKLLYKNSVNVALANKELIRDHSRLSGIKDPKKLAGQ